MPELLRRWAVEWLSARDPSVCEEIMAPEYGILIGGFLLDGRDAYVEGTLGQLDRFPGLGITVHQFIHDGTRAALRFTEHGASARHDDRPAAWGGIALFESDGERLTHCWAEEDYLSRRRQLAEGRCDGIEPPAVAPWNTPAGTPDPDAVEVVRAWLAKDEFGGVDCDDGWLSGRDPIPLAGSRTEIDAIFAVDGQVAFHGVRRGSYTGGVEMVDADREGSPAELHFAGLVNVAGGEVVGGRVVRDRLGLGRALQAVGAR